MVELIKSSVKCYKKKTKKMVGGRRKTYEYNQYQVPLKKSDNLTCSEEVFVVPQSQFNELVEAEVAAHWEDVGQHQGAIAGYEKELAELEWKHGELSRSYKALVSKNAKTNKVLRLEKEKVTTLEGQNQKLQSQMQQIISQYQDLKDMHEAQLKKLKVIEDQANLKKDQDIWTAIRSRFSNKEIKDEEDNE